MRRQILLALLMTAAAHAQTSGFSLQTFRPAVDSKGYVTVNASEPLGHLDFSLGLVTSYAHDVLRLDGNGRSFTVEHYLTPQLQAALGLWRRLELGLSLPVHIIAGARAPGFVEPANHNLDDALTFASTSLGDLGVYIKARFVDGERHAVGFGALVSVYAPTGNSAAFAGEGQVTIRPELILDGAFGRGRRVRVALNAGALVRPATHDFTDRGVTLSGDPAVNGGGAFCEPASSFAAPMTCGTGVARALGTQLTYSAAVAASLVPRRLDLIGEAFGYADPAHATANPLEGLLALKVYLAQKSYFEIGGGAGLLPGGMTGSPQFRVFLGIVYEPNIGDRDGDGIKDDVDRCPDEPEDFDDFEDEDGCPDPDNDRDGILDRDDQCPNEPGPVENNGCPETDSDGDGLRDADDECPRVPGPKDNRGCPPTATTRLRGGKIIFMKPIMFETGKAIIKPESFPTLDDVADTLRGNPQLLSVEIQGHADERSDDDFNMRLTEERARAVKRYLVDKGVAAGRLVARGYGETRPVCHAHDEACWSQNRRVEFVILRRSDGAP
jgi:OmpA-OmpF porin, OOP family